MNTNLQSPSNDTMDVDRYLRERVDFKIDLYQRLSWNKRNWYYVVASAAIILAAAVPVAVNIFPTRLIPTLLSLALTVLVGLEKLFMFREHWKNYDLAEDALRREKYLFQARTGVYAGRLVTQSELQPLEDEEAFRLFVDRFENLIYSERVETIATRTRPLEQASS